MPSVQTNSPWSVTGCGSLDLQTTPWLGRCRTTTLCTAVCDVLRTSSWQAIGWLIRVTGGPTHSMLTAGSWRPSRVSTGVIPSVLPADGLARSALSGSGSMTLGGVTLAGSGSDGLSDGGGTTGFVAIGIGGVGGGTVGLDDIGIGDETVGGETVGGDTVTGFGIDGTGADGGGMMMGAGFPLGSPCGTWP